MRKDLSVLIYNVFLGSSMTLCGEADFRLNVGRLSDMFAVEVYQDVDYHRARCF